MGEICSTSGGSQRCIDGFLGRPEGRRLLKDLGVDGNGSNESSAMLIILSDEDDSQFLYNSVASVPPKVVSGVHNFALHNKVDQNSVL